MWGGPKRGLKTTSSTDGGHGRPVQIGLFLTTVAKQPLLIWNLCGLGDVKRIQLAAADFCRSRVTEARSEQDVWCQSYTQWPAARGGGVTGQGAFLIYQSGEGEPG